MPADSCRGCCRDLFAVSLFILLAGFLVLELWLGKSLCSSLIFQGVKRWVYTSLNNRSILKTFFRDRYVQSPNKKPQLDFELIFEDYAAAYYNHNVIAYYSSLFAFCSIELFILLALFPLRWEETELSNNDQENLTTAGIFKSSITYIPLKLNWQQNVKRRKFSPY